MRTKRRSGLLGLGVLIAIVVLLVVLGSQSKDLRTEIEIAASPQTVWQILTDLNRYEEWNPHIPEAAGELREGSRLTVRIEERDGSSMTFRPTVTRVVPSSELRWLGRLFLPRVFDGEHIFEISALGSDHVRFVQRENFRGLLVLPFWNKLNTETRHGFEAMNAAIKARAETAESNESLEP